MDVVGNTVDAKSGIASSLFLRDLLQLWKRDKDPTAAFMPAGGEKVAEVSGSGFAGSFWSVSGTVGLVATAAVTGLSVGGSVGGTVGD